MTVSSKMSQSWPWCCQIVEQKMNELAAKSFEAKFVQSTCIARSRVPPVVGRWGIHPEPLSGKIILLSGLQNQVHACECAPTVHLRHQ